MDCGTDCWLLPKCDDLTDSGCGSYVMIPFEKILNCEVSPWDVTDIEYLKNDNCGIRNGGPAATCTPPTGPIWKSRSRTVTQRPSNGGNPCPALMEQRACV